MILQLTNVRHKGDRILTILGCHLIGNRIIIRGRKSGGAAKNHDRRQKQRKDPSFHKKASFPRTARPSYGGNLCASVVLLK